MAELKDLQSIIDKRATDRLNKDINVFDSMLSKHWKLLDAAHVYLPIEGKEGQFRKVELYSILSTSQGFTVRDKVFASKIEQYKAEEAANFIKKVDEVKEQVDELYNITSNLENR